MVRKDKRVKIMKAAEKLFTNRWYHEVTLDKVAKVAKVSKGAIYLHFKNKDDLFFQAEMFRINELINLLRRKIPTDTPFEEKLLAICRLIHSFFKDRKPMMRMHYHHEERMHSFRGDKRKRWDEQRQKLDGVITEVLSDGVAQGLVRSDVDAEVLARFLMVLMRTRYWDFISVPEKTPSLSVVLEIFLYGVGNPQRKLGGEERKNKRGKE